MSRLDPAVAARSVVFVGGGCDTSGMTFFTDLHAQVAAISELLPAGVRVDELGTVVAGLDDDAVCRLAGLATRARQLLEQLSLVAGGVISARSSREAGHQGLAQSLGYRSPVSMLQQVSGVTRAEALRQIRVGEALLDADPVTAPAPVAGPATGADSATAADPVTGTDPVSVVGAGASPGPDGLGGVWHAPLSRALREGGTSSSQHDAIRRGLGDPPDGAGEAWQVAAQQLLDHAPQVPVEDLGRQARAIRDLLDPDGARARYLARHEARSFRMWTDRDGVTHGRFVFDDESAEWVRSIIDTALRPRRGGPRFVAAAEQARAAQLQRDSRTNEQLAHDLLVDVLRAGAVANAETVFGVRQAGVRVVQVVDRDAYLQGARPRAATLHDSGTVIPVTAADQHRCHTGVQQLVVDGAGNPLDVGREQRLYTTRQRVGLAVRDGGCRWPGCDRPATYCEAHHIDHWGEDHGRTDTDCRIPHSGKLSA